ncbi:MAG TPA: hypothetical protein V6D18_12885 [Thermosynechococcaceae cyanobacterium]
MSIQVTFLFGIELLMQGHGAFRRSFVESIAACGPFFPSTLANLMAIKGS